MQPYLMKPSFYAHIFGAMLLLVSFVLFIQNKNSMTNNEILFAMLIFTGLVILHGISHLGQETINGYNPLNIFKVQ